MTDFREVKPLSGEPARSNTTFLPELVELRDQALDRMQNTEAKVQITDLSARIRDGEEKIAAAQGKVSKATLDRAREKLLGLKKDRAAIIFNTELPFETLDAVCDLLQRTTVLGATIPEGAKDAYIRVVIPGIISFEADLCLADIPF